MSQTATPAPAAPAPAAEPEIPKDPIVHKSYSVHVALAMLAVVGSTLLACYDEMWARRPYKAIQEKNREAYAVYLADVEAQRKAVVDDIVRKAPEFVELEQKAAAAKAASADEASKLDAELTTATRQGRAISDALKMSKSEIAALTYQAEDIAHSHDADVVEKCADAGPTIEKIQKIRDRDIEYSWTALEFAGERDDQGKDKLTSTQKTDHGKVGALLELGASLEVVKAGLQTKLAKVNQAAVEAAKAREAWLAENRGNLELALQGCSEDKKKETRARIAALGLSKYLDREVVSLEPGTVESIRLQVEKSPGSALSPFLGDIRQIHISQANHWIDRCETCHVNTQEPVTITADGMKAALVRANWPQAKIDATPVELFTTHPDMELLKKHDPQRFGCSTCHNGNGVAITNVELAHGLNKDWLWPLHPRENIEAGCVQCHQQDLVLAMGDRVTAGKDTFRRAGCWGCHKYEGFNKEVDTLTALQGRKKDLEAAIAEKDLRIKNLGALCGALAADDDQTAFDKAVPEKQREIASLTQEISQLRTDAGEVAKEMGAAYAERQRVGPNLKDVRAKLLREFLTDWIKSPRDAHKDATGVAFRPGAKMPTLRWRDDDEVKDVAAFIWQSALDPAKFKEYRDLPAYKPGDAAKGEELIKTVGCLACHSLGTGTAKMGNEIAANFSNLGEKDRPEFVMRWITNPRRRIVAYDPSKPMGERDVSGVAEGDDRYVWTQHAIMPNFRLSETEVRDITTFLVSQKRTGVKYEEPTWLEDQTKDAKGMTRFDRGRLVVQFQGCAGCHEIAGLEDEKGIGTELTTEGSKPIERLDFGHLTIAAERGEEPLKGTAEKPNPDGLLEDAATLFQKDSEWYRPRGFIMHKLAKPDIYDASKYLPDRFNRLRMPQFRFTAQEITDVTTFVLGSVDSGVPDVLRYHPDERGKAIREGWWVVKKYNCQGCHQILPTDEPALWKLPHFADKLAQQREQFLPPSLVGTGFRTRPEFLAKFLRDPSLGGGRENPKSLRPYLPERMPTFDFSDDEIRKIVRFFDALAEQPPVYQPPEFKPLSAAEQKAGAAIFKAANCQQCHVVAGAPITSETKAPNLSLAPVRLRPEWVRRWIADPAAMQPGTKMPSGLFGSEPDADGKRKYMTQLPELAGLPDDQLELIVRYLLQGLAGK